MSKYSLDVIKSMTQPNVKLSADDFSCLDDIDVEDGGYKPSKSDYSGRILFSLNEIYDGEVSFNCGPELDGCIDDTYDFGNNSKLEKLFSDLPKEFTVGIGASENCHSIITKEDVNLNELWKFIKARLIKAGAVEMKD